MFGAAPVQILIQLRQKFLSASSEVSKTIWNVAGRVPLIRDVLGQVLPDVGGRVSNLMSLQGDA